ncbi:MAG: hypothetical protein ACRC6R_02960 [Bacteroidales bacterium]
MKRALLLTTMALASLTASADLPKDPSTYLPVEGYQLTNNWIYSRTTDNFPAFLAPKDGLRGMAATESEIYFCKRNGADFSIVVVDGATGLVSRTVNIPSEPFQTGVDGEGKPTYLLAVNDIQIDSDGNVLVSNLCTDITASGFRVDKIDMQTGAITNILNDKFEKIEGTPTLRIDAFNVYGSVDGDGYLMAPIAGTEVGQGDIVLKWSISGGVVGEAEYIFLQEFVPSTATGAGTAPRVRPVNEDLFYHDGNATYPTLYDMRGNIVEGFNAENFETLKPINEGHNGVTEFTLNGDDFMVFAATNTVLAPASSFMITRLGEGMTMNGMQPIYRLPAAGFGNSSNSVRTAIPQVFVDEVNNKAMIYLYVNENGIASYEFSMVSSSIGGVDSENSSIVSSRYYDITGREVVKPSKGVFIVKHTHENGATSIEKTFVD